MDDAFLAMLLRMKYIRRWSLMHNTQQEDLSQHTLECALIVHYLALVGNTYYGKTYDPGRLVIYALYHDAVEILTGDLPTPVKYHTGAMRSTYRQVEEAAAQRLTAYLPGELQGQYRPYLTGEGLSPEEARLLKGADKLCAYIKCIVELKAGNQEFAAAHAAITKELEALDCPELAHFMEYCIPAFHLPLDGL